MIVMLGSPPQVRGKLSHCKAVDSPSRITPAGAGKTGKPRQTRQRAQDHPRRCGENKLRVGCFRRFSGSPPQVRGKLKSEWRVTCNYRITPAGAGKTRLSPLRRLRRADHPRRCGENAGMDRNAYAADGSPPQVRGKHLQTYRQSRKLRITPAGAGKTIYSA